jgi:hypothetical protein
LLRGGASSDSQALIEPDKSADSNARKIEHDDGDELYNSLLVPGQCQDYRADVGLSDVPA